MKTIRVSFAKWAEITARKPNWEVSLPWNVLLLLCPEKKRRIRVKSFASMIPRRDILFCSSDYSSNCHAISLHFIELSACFRCNHIFWKVYFSIFLFFREMQLKRAKVFPEYWTRLLFIKVFWSLKNVISNTLVHIQFYSIKRLEVNKETKRWANGIDNKDIDVCRQKNLNMSKISVRRNCRYDT